MEREPIALGHGGGGRMTSDLIREVFLPALANPRLEALGDAARLDPVPGRLAMTTDAFVVSPQDFPGGDIGALAIFGTVNDLAVSGARPVAISAAFILEEGLARDDLERWVASMALAARRCSVEVVTGDTKVVPRGQGDRAYVVTTGLGAVQAGAPPGPEAIREGDEVLVSGPVGDHGAVIAALRNALDPGTLRSDCGPVWDLVEALLAAGATPRFLRDPTRGGLGTVLGEMAEASGLSVEVRDDALPVRPEVAGLCDLLGLDPIFLACEGRVVAVMPSEQAEEALRAWRRLPSGQEATRIGRVVQRAPAPIVRVTPYGGRRLCDVPAAEPLPRIC
ncbi:MAG TPA: hydrogenase expression/formation protein HypE [Myxococcota bacterium]|mgnify:CR=1 FL=1|nr:hydrogenase expression/formation protein HypE [Myxococcota bacterium]HQK50586.1 hydrogenase expression/formation protein HypE [Myxococcota bacterium]